MKIPTILGVVGMTAVALLVGDWYLSLPIVQLDADGKCVRALVVENDHEVERPCNAVQGRQYLTEYGVR